MKILNSFQFIELMGVHGGNYFIQWSKGNNSKSRQIRVTVHIFCSLSFYICVKFCKKILQTVSELWSGHEYMVEICIIFKGP